MEVAVGEETINSSPPPPLTEKHEEPVTFLSSSTAAPLLQEGKMLVKLRIGSLIVGDSLQIGSDGGGEHGGGGAGGGGGVYDHGDVPMKIKEEFSILSSSINGQNNPNHGVRVCPECFKEFNSGKALGGHMRIHVQEATRKKQLLKPQKTTMFKNLHQHKLQQNPNPVQIMNGDRGEIPTCYHCGKTFPSKKSLYGHMRCHPDREWRGVIPPRAAMEGCGVRVGLMKTFKTSSPSASLSSSHESDFDMQLQPQPQLTTSGNDDGIYAFDDSDDVDESREAAVDLVKSMPRWATKAKRGRKAVSKDEDDEVLRDVAQDLMLLAQGGAQSFAESSLTQRAAAQVEDQFEGSNSNSMTKAENDDAGGLKLGSTDVEKGKAKGVVIMETATIRPTAIAAAMDDDVHQGNLNNWSDNESDSRNTHDHQQQLRMPSPNTKLDHSGGIGKMVKKRKKMKLMMDLDPNSARNMTGTLPPPLKPMLGNLATTTSPDQPSKYRCTTCNKSFTSHQALGGHRSSHNKVKLLTAAANAIDHHGHHENQEGDDEEYGSFVIHQLQGAEGEMVEKELSAAQQHECTICHKVFLTGQALGGHKRCHWTGGQAAEQAPSSQVTSNSPGEASHTTGGAAPARRVLEFDLNEAPPMEDEAVVGYGYGYSSSYNSNMG